MRHFRDELSPITGATHRGFEFDIYQINAFDEWKKIRTVKLINYQKRLVCGGSSGLEIYHRKNGKVLALVTVELYDMYMNYEGYGIGDIDKKKAYKKKYITLETLNTIDSISDKEDWDFST